MAEEEPQKKRRKKKPIQPIPLTYVIPTACDFAFANQPNMMPTATNNNAKTPSYRPLSPEQRGEEDTDEDKPARNGSRDKKKQRHGWESYLILGKSYTGNTHTITYHF